MLVDLVRQYIGEPLSFRFVALLLTLLYILWTIQLNYLPRRISFRQEEFPNWKWTKLGVSGQSNLSQVEETSTAASGSDSHEQVSRVQALFIYPIKSCRGVELTTARVSGTGLDWDRLFCFAQRLPRSDGTHEWRFITQREYPRLAQLRTEIYVPSEAERILPKRCRTRPDPQVLVRYPSLRTTAFLGRRAESARFRIPISSPQSSAFDRYPEEEISIWLDRIRCRNVTGTVDPKALGDLKRFLGMKQELALFRTDECNLRNITRSLPHNRPHDKFQVGFADAFPVHLLNVASARAVGDDVSATSGLKGSLDPLRFRANVYVSGPAAYAEDRWKKITIGTNFDTSEPVEYHVACRTARCVVVNVNQTTGIMDRKEPHATLKRTRQVDEGAKPHPCLGLSMIPLLDYGNIRVGDSIEILQTGEHVYEKMFK